MRKTDKHFINADCLYIFLFIYLHIVKLNNPYFIMHTRVLNILFVEVNILFVEVNILFVEVNILFVEVNILFVEVNILLLKSVY